MGSCEDSVLKAVIKGETILKNSRLLKYYTYSTQSKYHDYCEHRKQECSIAFEMDELSRVNIEGETWVKGKCDKMTQLG